MSMKAHMTHEEKRERREMISKAIKDGRQIPEVCRLFKVGVRTVYDACREFGVDLPDRRVRAVSA